MFEGLLYCKECGNRLTVVYRQKNDYWSINCNRYSRDPKRQRCTPHFFPYNHLEMQIKKQLNEVLSDFIKQLNINDLNNEIYLRKKKINDTTTLTIKNCEEKKKSISKKLTSLYNDRFEGNISVDSYKLLAEPLERDLNNLNKQIEAIQKNADNMKKNIDRIPDYSKQIKQLLDIYEPKRELLFALIDRIEIDENRMIYIKFKYDIIDTVIFKYEEITTPRNPNGRKGKKQKEM